jgi:hypothetical protein
MSIRCDKLKQTQKAEIEKIFLLHMNSDQFQEACLIVNEYLNKHINENKLLILKDTITSAVILYEFNSIEENSIRKITYLNHDGLKNDFLSIRENEQNLNQTEWWLKQNIINRIFSSSLSIISFEIGSDKNWIFTNLGILKNDLLGINTNDLDELFKKLLFSFNNIQVDLFAEWFNNLYKDFNKKQTISVLGGKFFLERKQYSLGGGTLIISGFQLRKDSFDNLLFYYNDHSVESGEFVKEQFNLCSIPKTDSKLRCIRLYDSKEETAYFNERYEDSILLFSYSKNK